MPNVVLYSEVLKHLSDEKRHHLLIGNGFSIGCDPCFSYTNLYGHAVEKGLGERAQKVFQRFGTNNFEAVMKLLDDGNWLAVTYGLTKDESEIARDLNLIKAALIESISKLHPDHTGKVDDIKKMKAVKFFKPFHNVFSLNYDILPYWINMMTDPPVYQDGFRQDPDDPDGPSLVFSERIGDGKGLYFVHGALHLFNGEGGLRKHCWSRTMRPITALIREGLEQARYPLFVSEGHAVKKMEQIQSSGYLSYCYGKLGRITQRLVIFGFSFGTSDQHISQAIAANLEVTEVFVGVYKNQGAYPDGIFRAVEMMVAYRDKLLEEKTARFRSAHRLKVIYFDSTSADVWGSEFSV